MGTSKTPAPLLVGIGASAGGLTAITEFLENLPEKWDCTCFIVQHQSADSEREMLAEILRKHTRWEVVVAEDGAGYGSNQVIVAPPGRALALASGVMHVTHRSAEHAGSMVIDSFFRSMAAEARGRSVAVVLSGSNADGTLGSRAIREESGLVIAQDPATAAFPTMPRSIVEDGLADLVLPPQDMPAHIAAFARTAVATHDEKVFTGQRAPEAHREKLLGVLRARLGHDFSIYKENTVDRRIQRHMSLHRIDTLKDYVTYVQQHNGEAKELFRDLLIGVTNFFRDPESFDQLRRLFAEEYLPTLEEGTVRVWVPGCATGEEAYSVAIIVQEAMEGAGISRTVYIYATDLDDRAISMARRGVFSKNIEADVSSERLKRYFTEREEGYRVRQSIRSGIAFAVQDITSDPPFSRLDLVCCRNVLIYLKPGAQKAVLSRIRYGLKDGGLLMLGSSESVSPLPDPFETVDGSHRIYRRCAGLEKSASVSELDFGSLQPRASPRTHSRHQPEEAHHSLRIKQATERFIVETSAPAVLVTKDGNALYFHGQTGKYFQPAPGPARNNIVEMAQTGLSLELSAALRTAVQEKAPQICPGIAIHTNDHEVTVDLYVRPAPLEVSEEPSFLVTLVERPRAASAAAIRTEDAGPAAAEAAAAAPSEQETGYSDAAQERIRELEAELQTTRQHMNSLTEEFEATNEELKSSNEELQSTNEELKSANEELETSKEELQSINEEQSTLNAELQAKNKELVHARDDMNNLLAGTQIATLFLDDALCIRRFTPAMQQIMGLRDSDRGRPVGEISVRVEYEHLERDAEKVLTDLNSVEREIRAADNRWFQLRIVPYRTAENVIDGVVATFNEITEIKHSEQQARLSQALAESTVNTIEEPLLVLGSDLVIEIANTAFLKVFKLSRDDVVGLPIDGIDNGQWDLPELRALIQDIFARETEVAGYRIASDFSRIGPRDLYFNARMIPVPDGDDRRMLLAITRVEERETA